MKFFGFLNKNIKRAEEIVEILKKDCKPFLKEIKGNGNFLYRGFWHRPEPDDDIKLMVPRKDRKPKDTSQFLHNEANKLFYKKFGWKPRSEGVFCTPYRAVTLQYSVDQKAYLVFPVRNFKYVWSPEVTDFYQEMNTNEITDRSFNKKTSVFYEIIDTYKDTDLKDALKKSNEIMIKCNSYYIVDDMYKDTEPFRELIK